MRCARTTFFYKEGILKADFKVAPKVAPNVNEVKFDATLMQFY